MKSKSTLKDSGLTRQGLEHDSLRQGLEHDSRYTIQRDGFIVFPDNAYLSTMFRFRFSFVACRVYFELCKEYLYFFFFSDWSKVDFVLTTHNV